MPIHTQSAERAPQSSDESQLRSKPQDARLLPSRGTHQTALTPLSSKSSDTHSSDAVSAAVRAGRAQGRRITASSTEGRTATHSMNGRQDSVRFGSTLSAPLANTPSRSTSPSHAAALAATAQATTTKTEAGKTLSRQIASPLVNSIQKPAIAAKPSSLSARRSESRESLTDTTSIAPTTSLVNLFEGKSTPTARPVPPQPPKSSSASTSAISTSKPLQATNGPRPILQNQVGIAERVQGVPHVPREETSRKEDIVVAPVQTGRLSDRGEIGSGEDQSSRNSDNRQLQSAISTFHSTIDQGDNRDSRADTGGPRGQIRAASDSPDRGRQGGQNVHVRATTQNSLSQTRRSRSRDEPPALPPRSATAKPQRSDTYPARLPSTDIPKSASRTPTAPIDILLTKSPSHGDLLSTSGQSSQSVNATFRQLYPTRHATVLTRDDELADAIVASSLASSRLNSPHRRDPPSLPTSRRQSRHGRSIFHSRTPSPSKGVLRQTLRKQESSSSDERDDTHPFNKHRKKRLIRKHPNKHHEGDRKRWRDAVTENERKRYEGVWAANKGLYLSPLPIDPSRRGGSDQAHDLVSNMVTRDIWDRSRLPDFELETIWDLVDSQKTGRLTKEEFVVGMWLIDQRLKGRKLPVKVTATVWASVRSLQGIKVRT